MDISELKKQIAYKAVDTLVHDNMKLGLGTGSTAVWIAHRIGELLTAKKLNNIIAVPTSLQTQLECEAIGIPVRSLRDPFLQGKLDLTIDGADEIDSRRRLIKGGGGALLREKICAYASQAFAIVADESKLVSTLGAVFAVPVEVIPEALYIVRKKIEKLGGKPLLRMGQKIAGPVLTEHGHMILDVAFGGIDDPRALEGNLKSIPGVVESGIFTCPVTCIVIGRTSGEIEVL
ncbi:MAG: ribose-5-phosphate isomerase RpiA [Spirochaetales bacterium]|nr:ribose-5-phosphate isomerase RpiA [Spirochaetales bacterium]